LGGAIPLTYQDGRLLPKKKIFDSLSNLLLRNAEHYNGSLVVSLYIRVYTENKKKECPDLSVEEREGLLLSLLLEDPDTEPIPASRKIKYKKKERRPIPGIITPVKSVSKYCQSFMVSDLETLMLDNKHRPYAAGLMLVHPGQDIIHSPITTFFSEDYSIIISSFEGRSEKVLKDLVFKIKAISQKEGVKTIYFHNFSRFDGILLLKDLASHHNFKLKTIMRNNNLYELEVYSESSGKLLFRFRDSMALLPGSLASLGQSLCPELGSKGSIDHSNVTLANIEREKVDLLEYMKQDVRLLAGIMQKARSLYYNLFQVDITSKITLSSLALHIFRLKFYLVDVFPIHIPNQNQDNFIRQGYYGGHTDVYIPMGENLYYYDVNSLYPFVMKDFPMPGGKPVWYSSLSGIELESMCGFIEAYIECPETIKRPLLPYRQKDKTLIFPTGVFVGVYYSEELKLAREIGYTVIPLSGYLYEKMESPFKDFVTTLYSSRLDAKNAGNVALSYVYKTLMNSLYGRFGINPESTTTEICDFERYKFLCRRDGYLILDEQISDTKFIVSYHTNTGKTPESWNPPKNSAIQLAAAITSCARIHMYKHISRDDCYYTDTDSVVLGSPLPSSLISSSVLGMFKLEDFIEKGYFLGPKAYCYISQNKKTILKFKGAAKHLIKPEWFEAQYKDPERIEEMMITNTFRRDWKELTIKKTVTAYRVGLKMGTKRSEVYTNGYWTDTLPNNINDMSRIGPHNVERIISYLKDEVKITKSLIQYEKIEEMKRQVNKKNDDEHKPETEEENKNTKDRKNTKDVNNENGKKHPPP
jgi:hypothetical protein